MSKRLKKFNEHRSKDIWWEENYRRLIDAVNSIQYEDWEVIAGDDIDMIMDQTSKHQALYLLDKYSIEELEELIDSYTDDEE